MQAARPYTDPTGVYFIRNGCDIRGQILIYWHSYQRAVPMPKSKNFQRNFAIVIGINTYHNRIPPLQTAAPDAEELARILKEQHERLTEKYQKQQKYEVLLLLNEDATLDKFKQLLEDFKRKQITLPQGKVDVSEDDRILFYFAGHGIASDALESQDGPAGYLIPQDAILDQDNTYLPMQELHDALLELPCRHLLTILDCCFAGAFRWASLSRAARPRVKIYKERFDRFISDRAWQVITSAADDQKALDSLARRGKTSDGKHSPFAQALFEALQGTTDENSTLNFDLNQDHILTATEIHYYLREKVETTTEEHYQRQTPGFCPLKKHQKGEFFFLLPGFNRDNLEDAPPLNLENNPYRGLEYYGKENSQLFYGRSKLIDKLCAHVASEKQALTVILGVSGTGKSSLMKAGLLPRLVAEHKYKILEMRVGDSPLTALAKVLQNADETIQNATQIAEEFAKDSQALVTRIKDWHKRYPNDQVLLAIDQFEELVTLSQSDSNPENKTGDSNTEQQQFQELLKEAIKQCPDCFDVVVTLRLDFEAQFQEDILKEFWESARFVVPPMTQDELREVIEKPASEKVLYFEPSSLVDDLINEVVQMPGGLPLLSFTLSELYLKSVKERRDNRALTDADYKALGKVIGSVTKRADEEYNALVKKDKAYEKTVRQVMLRMVAVGDEARRRVLLSELVYPDHQVNWLVYIYLIKWAVKSNLPIVIRYFLPKLECLKEKDRAKEVIKKFCDARLLVQGNNSEGKSYIEPAHDALIQNWQRLREWKEQEEETLILQRKLTPVANEWQEEIQQETHKRKKAKLNLHYLAYRGEKTESFVISTIQYRIRKIKQAFLAKPKPRGQSKNYLWHNDPRLAKLDLFLDSKNNWFNKTEDEFVRESVIQKWRNIYRVLGVAALTVFGLTALTNWALYEQRQAKIEHILTLREAAEANINSHRDLLALVDLLRAAKISKHWLVEIDPPDTALAKVQETMYKAFYTVKERNRFQLDRGNVYHLAFSPKTDELATVGDGDTIRLWDTLGNQRDQFSTGQGDVYSVAFSHDGKLLATGGGDSTVKLWTITQDGTVEGNSDNQTCQIATTGIVWNVAFSHDHQRLATLVEVEDGNNNIVSTVKLWDIKNGKCIQRDISNTELGKEGSPITDQEAETISYLAFSPQQELLATVGDNDTVKLWNISGKKLGEFTTNQGDIYSVAFTPDGKLATSGDEGTIKLWTIKNNGKVDFTSGKNPEEIKTDQTILYSIAFSRDSKRLATIGEDDILRLRDISRRTIGVGNFSLDEVLGNHILTIQPIQGSSQDIQAKSVAFSPDGKKLATIAGNNTVRLWDSFGKQIVRFGAGQDELKSVTFSPDGTLLATGAVNGEVSLWDTSGEKVDEISLQDGQVCDREDDNQTATAESTEDNQDLLPSHVTRVVFASLSKSDGSESPGLATISEDGTVSFLPIQEGEYGKQFQKTPKDKPCVEQFETDLGEIKSLAISPSGEQMVTVGTDDTINLWDLSSDQSEPIPIPKIGDETFTSVAFSPDGKHLAIADDNEKGRVRVWDISQKQVIRDVETLQGKIHSVVFSPLDSRKLVTGGEDGTVRLWDLSSNNPAQFSTEQGSINSMEFSPNSELLATISEDNKLQLWDIRDDGTFKLKDISNTALDEFQQQQGWVKRVTFSRNDQLILVGEDDTIRIWTISNNQFDQFETQQQQIEIIATSSDNQQLATLDKDGILKLWNIQDGTFEPRDISNSELAKFYQQQRIYSLGFSHDGKQLATGDRGTLTLWDVSGKRLDAFPTQQTIQSVAFSANGKKLATGGEEGMLKLWDIEGNLLGQIQTEQGSVKRLVFSPDNHLIATIGEDSTLKLWDASDKLDKSNKKLEQISTPKNDQVESVAFSGDSKLLAIGRKDGSIELRQVGDLDALTVGICNLVRDYLQHNPDLEPNDRRLCDGIPLSIERSISIGNKLLVPSITNPHKQSGVQAIASGNFLTTISDLETSLQQNPNDPEALIYLNNARIGTHESYTIAVSVPLGSDVNDGLEVLRGVAQAQDEINRKGGINGVPLRVLIADDNDDPTMGKKIAEELGKKSDVLGVIAHYSSDVTLAAGKSYQDHQLVAVSPVSSSVQWVKPDWHSQQYMFRTASKDDITAQALANYMLNGLKQQNAVVFYNSHSQYSQSLKSAFQDNIIAKGGKILEEFDLADPHFDAQDAVQKSSNLGAKVLVLMPNSQELDDALELMKAKEPEQFVLGGDALYGTKTLAAFPKATEKNTRGIVIAVPWHITGKSQSNFVETSRKLWWADVSWRTALSYDATQALIAALKQNPTRQGVAEVFQSDTFSVDGATGKVQFLPSGDRKNQLTNPLSQLVTIEPGSRSGYGYDFVIHPFTKTESHSQP